MTIGHVPVDVWLLVTVRFASDVHASDIITPPGRASNAATVVTAGGAAAALHPSTVNGVSVPVNVGAVVSFTLIVWTRAALVLLHASLIR